MRVVLKFFYYIFASVLLLIKLSFWIFFFSVFILHHNVNLNLQKYFQIPIDIEYSGYWNLSDKTFFINSLNIKSKNISIFNVNKIIVKEDTNEYNIDVSTVFIDYKSIQALFISSNKCSNSKKDFSLNMLKEQIENLLKIIPDFQIDIEKIQVNNLLQQPIKLNLQISKNANFFLSSKISEIMFNNMKISPSKIKLSIVTKNQFPFKLNIATNDNNFQANLKGNIFPINILYNLSLNDITKIYKIKPIEGITINHLSLMGNVVQNNSLIKIDSLKFNGISLYNAPIHIKSNNIIFKNDIISISNLDILNQKNSLNLFLNYKFKNNILVLMSNINLQRFPPKFSLNNTKVKGNIKFSDFNIKKLSGEIMTNFIIQQYVKNNIIKVKVSNNINIDNNNALIKNFNINIFDYNLNIFGYYNFEKNLLDISGKLENPHNQFSIDEYYITTDSLKIDFSIQNTLQNFYKLGFMVFADKFTIDTLSLNKIILMGENFDITNLKSGNFRFHIKGLYENNKILLPDIFANLQLIGQKRLLLNPIIIKLNNRDYVSLNSVFDFLKFPYTLKLNDSKIKYDVLNFKLSMRENATIDSSYNLVLPEINLALDTLTLIKGAGFYNILNSSGSFNITSDDIGIMSLTSELSNILDYELPIEEGILDFSSQIEIDSSSEIKINSDIRIKDFFLYNYFIDSININVTSDGNLISLQKLTIDNPDNNFILKGELDPYTLNYDFILSGDGQIPMILSEFIDSLYMISGNFKLNTSIKGNKGKIKLNGDMVIDSTDLYFSFLDNKISNFKADIIFKDDSVIINKISANTEEIKSKKRFSLFSLFKKKKKVKNNILGDGKICISDLNFMLNSEFKNLFLRYLPIRSDFIINGKVNISKLKDLPYIKGDLYFKEFNLTDDFSEYIASPDDSIYVFYNITLHFPNNFWIKNKYVNLEASGDIKIWLEDFKEMPEIYGTLDVKRGEIYVYGYNFKINKGQIKFTEANKLNPEFDINATTKVKDLNITLYFRGTLQNPEFDFTSYPIVLSREEIIKYFFGTITENVQKNNISNQAENIVSNILMQKISQVGVQKLGFDQFKFNSNEQQETSGFSEIIDRLRFSDLQIGKYITPKLFISYKGKLTLTSEKSVSIEYYLDDNFSIIGEKKFDGNYKIGLRFKTDF